MKFLSLSINGTPIPGPGGTQNIVDNAGPFGKTIIKNTIDITIIAIILVSFSYFIYGAIKLMTSRGDKEQFNKAREQIAYSITGLAIALAAIFIINLVGGIFGIDLFQLFK